MKKFLVLLIIGLGIFGYFYIKGDVSVISPKGVKKILRDGELAKYDFDSLKKRGGVASEIKFGGVPEGVKIRRENELIQEYGKKKWKKYDVRNFETKIISFQSNGKKITGMINIPMMPSYAPSELRQGKPVIIMIRGFADLEGYYTGFGTWKAADRFAEAGFVTVSLDFLGFGGSDNESRDILEARFEKVVSVLDLIESVKRLDFVDPNRIGIWSHSNGGQIALSVLEITGANYPTTLWAPMTNPFPQSVLDTAGDNEAGKLVKQAIENFEKQYDSRRYAFENYLSWIKAPIQIHQGTGDEWCEVKWQEDLQSRLKLLGKDVDLYIYKGDDHNLKKNWEMIISRDLDFFNAIIGLG